MNQLQIFKKSEFGEIRVQTQNNETWFCLSDLCRILEISNPADVKKRLSQKGIDSIDTLTNGGNQSLVYVNESNLYKVIFQSRKPEAEKFTEWVTSEVLPSIRKHGLYATEELLNDPDLAIKAFTALKEERERNKALTAKISEDKPKVLFADAVETAQTSILVGDLAKLIKQNGYDIGQNRLFKWLRSNDYLIKSGERQNMPTQTAMNQGLFEVKERTLVNPDGSVRITKTPKVTGKGQVYFINLFLGKKNKTA